MEKILKQFLIDDIIYNILYPYLLDTDNYQKVIDQINQIKGQPNIYLYNNAKRITWSRLPAYIYNEQSVERSIKRFRMIFNFFK